MKQKIRSKLHRSQQNHVQKKTQSFNKKRILIGFSLTLLMILVYSIAYASITPPSPIGHVQVWSGGATWSSWEAVAPQNNQIFYCENNSRWYALINYYDGSGLWGRYWVSDEDNASSWSVGGWLGSSPYMLTDLVILGDLGTGQMVSWQYNETTNEVHATSFSEAWNEMSYYYGQINWTDNLIIWNSRVSLDTPTGFGHVDITITDGGFPAVASGTNNGNDGDVYVYVSETVDGSGSWNTDWFRPYSLFEEYPTIIPTGEKQVVVLSAPNSWNAQDLRYEQFSNTSTVGGGTGTALPSQGIWKYTGNQETSHYSTTYDENTIYVVYTNSSGQQLYYYSVAISTMTQSSETLLLDLSSENLYIWSPTITLHAGSVFPAFMITDWTTTSEGNYTMMEVSQSTGAIVTTATQLDQSDLNHQQNTIMLMSTMTHWANNDGEIVLLYWDVSSVDLEGVIINVAGITPIWTIDDTIDYMLSYTMSFLGLIGLVMLCIAPIVVYKKKKNLVDAVLYGFILFIIGLGLFVAWVFSGG